MSVITGSPENEDENDDDDDFLIELSGEPIPRIRELVSLALLVLVADLTIYRGEGYAGLGLLFLCTPFLLRFGGLQRIPDRSLLLLWVMLGFSACRLFWNGTPLAATIGLLLIPCFSMSRAGIRPFIPEWYFFMVKLLAAGLTGINVYLRRIAILCQRFTHWNWIAISLPLLVGSAFSFLFIRANPDLMQSVGDYLSKMFQDFFEWLTDYPVFELLFCLSAAWIGIGLLRPKEESDPFDINEKDLGHSQTLPSDKADPLYAAFRNTLWLVIALFAVYLVFEFRTMWFRVFPAGFHYSGYAHEGAAWLTVALALATAVLSLIFRGRVLRDQRTERLKKLAYIWSIENLLLAVAVYYRLMIYVGFNGMTWARILGFYGVTTVVAGFLLVLWKIHRRYNFVWLIRRQLWALAIAIYLFSISPVDYLAMNYNCHRILAGDPKPAVQFSVQQISSGGIIAIRNHFDQPNVKLDDPVIQAGIQALLRERYNSVDLASNKYGWTAWQLSDSIIRRRSGTNLPPPNDSNQADWDRFKDHVYQWF